MVAGLGLRMQSRVRKFFNDVGAEASKGTERRLAVAHVSVTESCFDMGVFQVHRFKDEESICQTKKEQVALAHTTQASPVGVCVAPIHPNPGAQWARHGRG